MDHAHLDHLTRTLLDRLSRRGLGRVGGGLLGALGLSLAISDHATAKKNKQRKKKCKSGLTKCKVKKGKKKKIVCVNTQTDPKNCGGCKKVCAAGETCSGGTCGSSACLSPGADLQQAINDAAPGATLCLNAGTFSVTDEILIEQDLNLTGQGADTTILQGSGAVRVLRIIDEVTAELDGLGITGGLGNGWGGGGIQNFGQLTMRHCHVWGNNGGSLNWGGGGIQSFGSLTMSDCEVSENHAGDGDGGGIDSSGELTMENCLVHSNTAYPAELPEAGDGGGIWTGGYSVVALTACTIRDNSAGGRGGGIHAQGVSVTLTDCVVTRNDANEGAGGLYSRASTTLTGCTVSLNESSGGGGGGLRLLDGAMAINTSDIHDNTGRFGGGIFVGESDVATSLVLNDTSVTGNTATYEGANTGGGIYNDGVPVTLTNGSTVTDNEPDNCAGAFIAGCTN